MTVISLVRSPHVKFGVRQGYVHTAESRLALSELWVFICRFCGGNCLGWTEISGYKQLHEMSEMGNIIIIYIMENIWYTKTAQKIQLDSKTRHENVNIHLFFGLEHINGFWPSKCHVISCLSVRCWEKWSANSLWMSTAISA